MQVRKDTERGCRDTQTERNKGKDEKDLQWSKRSGE